MDHTTRVLKSAANTGTDDTRFVLDDGTAELTMWGVCECSEINHPEYGEGLPVVNGHCIQCDEPVHNAAKCPCTRCEAMRVDHYGPAGPPVQKVELSSEQYELEAAKVEAIREQTEMVEYQNELIAEYEGNMPAEVIDMFTRQPEPQPASEPETTTTAGIVLGSLWENGKPPARTKPTGGDLCMVPPVDPEEPPYGLLMRHKRHAVIGDYEVGKTHVLATMALQCTLEDPNLPICFLDFADDLEAIHWRLIDLGMYEQLAHRITYATSLAEADAQPADCLLLVDEFTGATTEAGLNQNSMSDIETIWQRLHGPDRTRTVVAADHRRKEAENRRDFASGSSFKMAVVNGFAYFLENQAIAEPNLPMNIPLRLVKSKASPSLRTRGMRNPKKPGEIWIANLSIMIDPEGWATDQWAYRPMEALPATGQGNLARQRERDTRKDKLLTWSRLTSGEPVTAADAARYVDVTKNTARKYLQELVEDGDLVADKGPRGAITYQLNDRASAQATAQSPLKGVAR